jgi:GNAT superfamily N-acetyltransferase
MSVTFQVERLAEALAELKPLYQAHWDELPHLRPKGALNPDYERGIRLNDAGAHLLVTARREGRLIGYCQFYIDHDIWTGEHEANGEVIYLLPAERRGWLAVRLYEYAHDVLRHVGVKRTKGNVTRDNPMVPIMERVGYEPSGEIQYVRTL